MPPTKTEAIARFLSTLKTLHRTGDTNFTIHCDRCGSKNCQVIVFPDLWQTDGPLLDRGVVGIKCLDCGCAGNVDYGESAIYG